MEPEPQSSSPIRMQRNIKGKKRVLMKFRRSPQNQSQFAAKHKINPSQLSRWIGQEVKIMTTPDHLFKISEYTLIFRIKSF